MIIFREHAVPISCAVVCCKDNIRSHNNQVRLCGSYEQGIKGAANLHELSQKRTETSLDEVLYRMEYDRLRKQSLLPKF